MEQCVENVSQQPSSPLARLANAFNILQAPLDLGDGFVPPRYWDTEVEQKVYFILQRMIPSFLRGPEAVGDLNTKIRSMSETVAGIVSGIESPREEMEKEVEMLADRISALVPKDIPQPSGRRAREEQARQEIGQADEFGESMVKLLEEILNGTNDEGQPTDLVMFSRLAHLVVARALSPEQRAMLFAVELPDGRIHFNEEELEEVGKLRGSRIKRVAINTMTGGLLKEDAPPVSAYRVVKAVSGRLARGILRSYLAMPHQDEGVQERVNSALTWLEDHQGRFDQQVDKALRRGRIVNESVRVIDDAIVTVGNKLQIKLPAVIDIIPPAEELEVWGETVRTLKNLGLEGLSPLADSSPLRRGSV